MQQPRRPTHMLWSQTKIMAVVTVLHRIATPLLFSPRAAYASLPRSLCAPSIRYNSSSSNRWKYRQFRDVFVKAARLDEMKSRAAFKLMELHAKNGIFQPGQTVVDLGFAPGAWSQVAIDRVSPTGRVIGVDILPAQPPPGVSTFQGSMKSAGLRELLKNFLMDPERGRVQEHLYLCKSYLDREREAEREEEFGGMAEPDGSDKGRTVDVVLSDMSDPWPLPALTYRKSFDNVFLRLMNVSGIPIRDHAYSIDLCYTALSFAMDVLKRQKGVFVCKVYRGDQEERLKEKLKLLFGAVRCEKPEASRNESKEVYYVAKRIRTHVTKKEVFPEGGY